MKPGNILRQSNFARIFAASSLSSLGSAVTYMALPLTAISLLKASATDMGILVAIELLPFILFNLPGGVLIDRYNKRNIIVASDILAALGVLAVPFAWLTGGLSMQILWVCGFMVASNEAIGGTANQVYVTIIAGKDRLVQANGLLGTAQAIATITGPALAAALIAWWGAPLAMLADSLSFLLSAGLIASIRHTSEPLNTSTASLAQGVREGLQAVRKSPVLRSLVLVVFLWITLNDSFKALWMLHVTSVLGMSAGTIALINTLGAIGGLLAAAFASRMASSPVSMSRATGLGLLIAGVGMVLFTLPGPEIHGIAVCVAIGMFIMNLGASYYVINYLSLRQAFSPGKLLGRVVSTMRFLTIALSPLGTIGLGMAADFFQVAPVIAVMGSVTVVLGAISMWKLPRDCRLTESILR